MCYKKPGPRCSKYARIKLTRARDMYDFLISQPEASEEMILFASMEYQEALRQYDMTLEGQKNLQTLIELESDGTMESSRDERRIYELKKRLVAGKAARASTLAELKRVNAGRKPRSKHTPTASAIFALAGDTHQTTEQLTQLIKSYTHKYGNPLGQGRHRVVYDRGDGSVVKIPLSWQGCLDNWTEADWNSTDSGIPLAECSMSEDQGVPILIMEKVEPLQQKTEMPEWASRVDCHQVGRTAAGTIVAYDL